MAELGKGLFHFRCVVLFRLVPADPHGEPVDQQAVADTGQFLLQLGGFRLLRQERDAADAIPHVIPHPAERARTDLRLLQVAGKGLQGTAVFVDGLQLPAHFFITVVELLRVQEVLAHRVHGRGEGLDAVE
jgi:hypothetical protein